MDGSDSQTWILPGLLFQLLILFPLFPLARLLLRNLGRIRPGRKKFGNLGFIPEFAFPTCPWLFHSQIQVGEFIQALAQDQILSDAETSRKIPSHRISPQITAASGDKRSPKEIRLDFIFFLMDFFLCGKPKPNPDFSSLHGKKSLFMLNFSFSDIWDWFCHQILSGEGEKPGNFVCPEEQTVRLEIYSRLFPDCSDPFHTSSSWIQAGENS